MITLGVSDYTVNGLVRYSCSKCGSGSSILVRLSLENGGGRIPTHFPIQYCWHCGERFTDWCPGNEVTLDELLGPKTPKKGAQ